MSPLTPKEKKILNFTKKTHPAPIPQEGIEQVVKLMETGHLFRYHFEAEISEETISSDLENEPATEVAKLEDEFSRYTGHKYVVAVNSCGSALFLSLKAARLQHNDKVLTNAFTFTAVSSSIVHAGGIPTYVECNRQYLVDIDDFKRKIQANPDAKFFIVSHMRGYVSEMETLKALCDEAGIYLIEDCAHSLGAKWYDPKLGQDELVGHHGKMACFSTQSYKLLNSGEGGFVATDDDKMAAYCILAAGSYEKLYKKHLSRPFDDELFEAIKLSVPNFSLRMNNLTAAILRPQIPMLEERISAYNQRYKQLANILATADNIDIPSSLESVTPVCDSLQFNLINVTTQQAEKLVQHTSERGVKIQLFGHKDNARYFKNWQYSFQEVPILTQTDEIVRFACDLKLSLSFDTNDIDLMGYIIKDTLYKIVAAENKADYPTGLADRFEDLDEVISKYDNWVSNYDQHHQQNGWKGLLNHVAYTLTSYLNGDDKILDIGCGTGLLGKELNSYRFKNLNGIDISEKSLQFAETFNIYQGLSKAELGKILNFEDNSFDALVSCGVFTRQQVPLNSFEELIRILKPEGLFLLALRVEDNDFYYNQLKKYYVDGVLGEVFKTRFSVLSSCNHELVLVRKLA